MLKNIPVNIITGFLGVGKTTAIRQLLAQKPSAEKWAVLVNEFGQVGIDQAAFATEDGVTIKELPGGCICCTLGLPLVQSLVRLLQQAKPDRLIIEPTGIGHPAGIIDTLSGESFAGVLDIRATICLVDPRALADQQILDHPIYQDQINLADVLVLNKCDLAPAALIAAMEQRAGELFPPKAAIVRAVEGRFELSLLEQTGQGFSARYPQAHQHSPAAEAHPADSDAADSTDPADQPAPTPAPSPGQPLRQSGSGFGHYSYGWLFHPDDSFDLDRLGLWCQSQPQLQRLKGAFRVGRRWVLINQVRGEQVVSPLSWRRDSRLELISTQPLDEESLTAQLLDCLHRD